MEQPSTQQPQARSKKGLVLIIVIIVLIVVGVWLWKSGVFNKETVQPQRESEVNGALNSIDQDLIGAENQSVLDDEFKSIDDELNNL